MKRLLNFLNQYRMLRGNSGKTKETDLVKVVGILLYVIVALTLAYFGVRLLQTTPAFKTVLAGMVFGLTTLTGIHLLVSPMVSLPKRMREGQWGFSIAATSLACGQLGAHLLIGNMPLPVNLVGTTFLALWTQLGLYTFLRWWYYVNGLMLMALGYYGLFQMGFLFL